MPRPAHQSGHAVQQRQPSAATRSCARGYSGAPACVPSAIVQHADEILVAQNQPVPVLEHEIALLGRGSDQKFGFSPPDVQPKNIAQCRAQSRAQAVGPVIAHPRPDQRLIAASQNDRCKCVVAVLCAPMCKATDRGGCWFMGRAVPLVRHRIMWSWQGRTGSNRGPTVLETVALPTELHP